MTKSSKVLADLVDKTIDEMTKQNVAGIFIAIDPQQDAVYSTSNLSNAEDLLEIIGEMVYIAIDKISASNDIIPGAIGQAIEEIVRIAIDESLEQIKEKDLFKNKGNQYEN